MLYILFAFYSIITEYYLFIIYAYYLSINMCKYLHKAFTDSINQKGFSFFSNLFSLRYN